MAALKVSPDGKRIERTDWFAQRRNHFVRQVVDEFFHFVRSFQRLYGIYLDCRSPQGHACSDLLSVESDQARGQIWNQLVQMIGKESDKGPIWQLKDLCHLVWPENDREQNGHGSLIDWLLGSVFHEAMKLKENIYLLNTYGPAAVRIKERSPGNRMQVLRPTGPFPQLSSMVDVEALIRRIAMDVVSQMEQIGFLLGQANFILRLMMPDLSANMLVVRLLVEEEELVQRLWGETLDELFVDMFFGNVAQGFCTAGRSYLSGQWYARALAMYERALESDSTCDEALAKVVQLRGIVKDHDVFEKGR